VKINQAKLFNLKVAAPEELQGDGQLSFHGDENGVIATFFLSAVFYV
jgi:hypothetical protein